MQMHSLPNAESGVGSSMVVKKPILFVHEQLVLNSSWTKPKVDFRQMSDAVEDIVVVVHTHLVSEDTGMNRCGLVE